MKMEYNILRRVRMIEEKNGIHYAKTDGKLFGFLRFFFALSVLYTLFINALYLLGMTMTHVGTKRFDSVIGSLITVGTCSVFLLAGFILSFVKLHLLSGIFSILSALFLIPTFAGFLDDPFGFLGYKPSFYFRHFIPLALVVIFSLLLIIISQRARMKTEKQYKRVLDSLYEIYQTRMTEELSEEQWEEFLSSYDPTNYRALFKK